MGRMGCKEDCCLSPITFCWFLTPFYATCHQKFWFFKNMLIIEQWKEVFHWIWHALNPKSVPLKPFQCIFPSQNATKCDKFCTEFFIFHEPLIIVTQNLYHWIWHITNPKYMPLRSFWWIFPSQNLQNVKFRHRVTELPLTQNEKRC